MWKIGLSGGHDDTGNRRRVLRTVRGTKADAFRKLADMRAEIVDGSRVATRDTHSMSVDELVRRGQVFARDDRELEHSTRTGYARSAAADPEQFGSDIDRHSRRQILCPCEVLHVSSSFEMQ